MAANAGIVCNMHNCDDVYSGYSAANWGAIGIGPYNTNDDYPTSESSGGRHQQIGYGADGESLTFSFDKDGWTGLLFGERGALGLAGQLAGLKPTSVMHDYLVTTKEYSPLSLEFYGSMVPSYAIAQSIAHTSYRVNLGYRKFRYAY